MGSPFENISEITSIKKARWALTDDTQLTLATCEAITACRAVDPAAIASSFVDWYRAGRLTGIGSASLHALRGLAAGGHWALVGRKGEMSAGNGAAMRIAPLAFLLNPFLTSDRKVIRDVCRITHHNEEAYAGSLAVLLAMHLLGSLPPETSLVGAVAMALPDCRVRDQLLAIAQVPKGTPISWVASEFGSSGYVVHSVPLALFAVQQHPGLSFEVIMMNIISAGGDTDTNASITGQILGSYVGVDQLPDYLISRLPSREQLELRATEFAKVVESE